MVLDHQGYLPVVLLSSLDQRKEKKRKPNKFERVEKLM